MLTDGTELAEADCLHKGKAAIQRDLDRLKEGVNWSHEIQQGQGEVLHLGRKNPLQRHRQGSCASEKDVGLNASQQRTLAAKNASLILSSTNRNTAIRSREGIIPLCLAPLIPYLVRYIWFWKLRHKKSSLKWSKFGRGPPR